MKFVRQKLDMAATMLDSLSIRAVGSRFWSPHPNPFPRSLTTKLMKASSLVRLLAPVAMLAFMLPARAGTASHNHQDLVAVAASAGQFKTLVAAVKAAGLVETLQGPGPFTIFAPTDEAFAKLPAGTVESLLKPENKQKLVGILTYHVIPSKVLAADVKTMQAKTVNGQSLAISAGSTGVTVNGAKVVATDIAASNGVIHVIDTVVLPQ